VTSCWRQQCSTLIHAPELAWQFHPFAIAQRVKMAWCIVNSHHSGHCACGNLLKGHGFEHQRSKRLSQQSLQSKPSRRQRALRPCGVSPTVCSEASAHTELLMHGRTEDSDDQRSQRTHDLLLLTVDTHWSGQLMRHTPTGEHAERVHTPTAQSRMRVVWTHMAVIAR